VPADVRADHGRMRATIFEAIVGRQPCRCAPTPMNEGPRPMEVDAITGGKGGKGKKGSTHTCKVCGKFGHFAKVFYWRGSRGKGKGKGSPKGGKGSGKNHAPEKFLGKRNYCQKMGHKQSECRKKDADEKQKARRDTNAITSDNAAAAAKGFDAIERYDSEDGDGDFFCMCLDSLDMSVCAVIGGSTFITLVDTASDCHHAPSSFGEGCPRKADSGPTVRDAQRQTIKFDAVATVPMTTTGEQASLLKANFRLGETVSKPILSLLEVIDNVAEVWFSKGDMKMFANRDYGNGIPLTRKHNTMGLEVMTFAITKDARQYAGICAFGGGRQPERGLEGELGGL
jgi:hypothetical protein